MSAGVSYQTLDPGRIIATLETLERRIGERFPNSGLAKISAELTGIARQTTERIAGIARPYIGLRLLLGIVLAAGITCIAWLIISALRMEASTELTNVMQGADAGVSLLIVLGGSALYLSTLESRWRRDQALKALHEFRSIVHVIDMHQLTKDPSAFGAPRTSSSPDRSMTVPQLLRYLGYCSELLSLAGKVAALYADKLRDPVVIDAVGDIERLTTDLSQKIWQKIELFQQRMPSRPPSDLLGPHS
jgi:hypothetical protein